MIECFSKADALRLLRHCLEQGIVQPGTHFRQELAAENVGYLEALKVLKGGNIYREPELDTKTRDWKYTVEGHEPGGKWLAIVFTFREVNHTFLITAFSIQARNRTQ